MAYKRKRIKTGDESYKTITTTTDGGKRTTYSHKSGNITRSTSISTKKPGIRRTTTFNPNNGGWITRKSYTTKTGSYKSKVPVGGLGVIATIPIVIALLVMGVFPSTIPYVLGLGLIVAVAVFVFTYIAYILLSVAIIGLIALIIMFT